MTRAIRRSSICLSTLALFALAVGSAAAADLPAGQPTDPAPVLSGWTSQFTLYGWVPWLSGNATVKGRDFKVQVDPSDIFGALNMAAMGTVEARKGPFSIMIDGFYANVGDSAEIFRARNIAAIGASLSSGGSFAVVEMGGSYEVMRWGSGGLKDTGGTYTALDLLAGARYWQQSVDVNLNITGVANIAGLQVIGSRGIARSGLVEWTDPYVGARIRYQLAPGQELALRGDIGGFDVGSTFSWQVLATYNRHLFDFSKIPVDSYLGFRALSVDYSQGSGVNRYVYDVVQYGPVLGLSLHF